MKKIDFIDLKSQYKAYKDEIDESIRKVCENASFIMGEDVKLLEENLSRYIGSKNSISCSSGTDALLLSLMALDVQPGDEVITTPFSFIATAEVISFLGAKPVFADIDEKTYNIDPAEIEKKITEKTKAIIPVALYGQPADMDEINDISAKHSLAVIEDACQSFGSEYKGKKSCNLSTIGCTSFFPSKPLGCYGDGGAVFTNDDEIAAKIKSLRVHGQTKRYHHKYIGMNGRLDTIQAAILNVKLAHFDDELKKRAEIASKYSERLKNVQGVVLPFVKNDRTSVFAQYSIRVKKRDEIIKKLNEAGIPTAVHYPVPMHLQEACRHLGYKEGDFPVSEAVSREIMSIPMGPFLNSGDQRHVAENIIKDL
jgi:UDP-2-acetamido-2-deoxy-ribo-hexuluronate aminotransferase